MITLNTKLKIKQLIENAQYICLFIVLVGLFIGTMYAHGASLMISVPISFGLIYFMNYVIGVLITLRKELNSAKSFSMGKSVWWGLYLLIALPISYYTIHMFNVEFGELEYTKKIGAEKANFIIKTHEITNNTIDKNYRVLGVSLWNDVQLGQKKKEDIAEYFQIQSSRVELIIDAENANLALKPQKINLMNSVSICFKIDSNLLTTLESHNFRQEKAIISLDKTLNFMLDSLSVTLAQNLDTKNVDYTTPTKEQIMSEINKKSLISQPLALFSKEPLPSFLFVFLVNIVILLPVMLSERIRKPPPSTKTNQATTY